MYSVGILGRQNRVVCQGVKYIIYMKLCDVIRSSTEGQRKKQQPLNVMYKLSYLQQLTSTTHFMIDKIKAYVYY
jgi:hypothetical protein